VGPRPGIKHRFKNQSRETETNLCLSLIPLISRSIVQRFNEERYGDMEKADFRKRDDSEADDRTMGIVCRVKQKGYIGAH